LGEYHTRRGNCATQILLDRFFWNNYLYVPAARCNITSTACRAAPPTYSKLAGIQDNGDHRKGFLSSRVHCIRYIAATPMGGKCLKKQIRTQGRKTRLRPEVGVEGTLEIEIDGWRGGQGSATHLALADFRDQNPMGRAARMFSQPIFRIPNPM